MYNYPYFDYRDGSGELFSDLTQYTYPKNYHMALRLIKNALDGERSDELFYNYLVSVAKTDEARQIVSSIRDDEIKHNKMFRTIYYQLTGQLLPYGADEPFMKPSTYCEGLKKALKGELEAIKKYHQILFAMENPVHYNMLTEIITDEIRHSGLYNYLLISENCF